jgi:hypothetical protein
MFFLLMAIDFQSFILGVLKNTHIGGHVWFFDTEKTGIRHRTLASGVRQKQGSKTRTGERLRSSTCQEPEDPPARRIIIFLMPNAQCLMPDFGQIFLDMTIPLIYTPPNLFDRRFYWVKGILLFLG